jgi:hypothetical protein
MTCSHCGKSHSTKYHLENNLSDSGFPTHDKKYNTAHEEATKKEKSKFPRKQYNKLKKMDRSVSTHELLGKNSQKGKIEVDAKVPKKLRSEVAFHERVENKILRKK